MKLTARNIHVLSQVLKTTGDFTPDNRPVARTRTGKEMSALRWFDKNTEEVMKNYQDILRKTKEKYEKKYEKEQKEHNETVSKLSKIIKQIDEKSEKEVAELFKVMQKFLQSKNPKSLIDKDLSEDKDILKAFNGDTHDIKCEQKTIDLIKECLNDYAFVPEQGDVFDNEEISKLIEN